MFGMKKLRARIQNILEELESGIEVDLTRHAHAAHRLDMVEAGMDALKERCEQACKTGVCAACGEKDFAQNLEHLPMSILGDTWDIHHRCRMADVARWGRRGGDQPKGKKRKGGICSE